MTPRRPPLRAVASLFDSAQAMDFNQDHFALFGLPRAFRIDAAGLDTRYRELQSQIHPDRFAGAGEAERRLSLQWATRANEAYGTLRKPLARARYLLELEGHDIGAEHNTAMAPEFLIEQMEWREAAAEARAAGDHHELERLHGRLRQTMDERYAQLAEILDDRRDLAAGTELVRRLMFLEKLQHEIDDALAAFDD